MFRVAATSSREKAFCRAPLAASLFAASLSYASKGEKSCCNLCFCSVTSSNFVEEDGGFDGVVGVPEFLP